MKISSLILMLFVAVVVPFTAVAADIEEATIEVIDINDDRSGVITNRIELPDGDRVDHKEHGRDHKGRHDANDEKNDHSESVERESEQEQEREREDEREHESEREDEREHEIEDKEDDHKEESKD